MWFVAPGRLSSLDLPSTVKKKLQKPSEMFFFLPCRECCLYYSYYQIPARQYILYLIFVLLSFDNLLYNKANPYLNPKLLTKLLLQCTAGNVQSTI